MSTSFSSTSNCCTDSPLWEALFDGKCCTVARISSTEGLNPKLRSIKNRLIWLSGKFFKWAAVQCASLFDIRDHWPLWPLPIRFTVLSRECKHHINICYKNCYDHVSKVNSYVPIRILSSSKVQTIDRLDVFILRLFSYSKWRFKFQLLITECKCND